MPEHLSKDCKASVVYVEVAGTQLRIFSVAGAVLGTWDKDKQQSPCSHEPYILLLQLANHLTNL